MDDIDILKSTLSQSDMSSTFFPNTTPGPNCTPQVLPIIPPPNYFSDYSPPAGTSLFQTNPTIIPEAPARQRRSGVSGGGMAAMREMIFRIAAMQPVEIDPEAIKAPKRRNVRISKDPQSVAARHRRERISQKIRILQRLVPGGTKMDTASMLDEAVHYVKFLKRQVQTLEQAGFNYNNNNNNNNNFNNFNNFVNSANLNYASALFKACQIMPASLQMQS